MNPHAPAPLSLASLVRSLLGHHELIVQMTKREVIGRYKGSVMGLMWSFVNPVLLLTMYTLVFSVVFKARWGTSEHESKMQFAVLLFVGMIVHSLFSETLTRAPSLILSHVNYVKKIVFPLEILPVVTMSASVFHAIISLVVLSIAIVFINGYLPWTSIFLPLVLLPLIVLSLGIAWILASLGVFLRDVAQPIGLAMTILLFASPVFYPLTALPEYLRPWLMLNPLTFIIEQARAVLIDGQLPYIPGLLLYMLVSLVVAWAGYVWFQKTRKGFANVL
jgi:lipopolysaccharide transport system permease protein